jgi:hypothetical protein
MSRLPVQFRGTKSVIEAYERCNIPSFAIFTNDGKQLLYPCQCENVEEGKQLLFQYLEAMCNGNEAAIATYTIKVYDDLKKGEKIRANRDYAASFNFKLFSYDQWEQNGMPMPGQSELRRTIEEQGKQIADLQLMLTEKENDNDTEGVGGAMGMIGALLEMPGIKEMIAGKIVSMVNRVFPDQVPESMRIGKVAGAFDEKKFGDPSQQQPQPMTSDEQLARLNAALEILYQADPKLVEHLESLAQMAKEKPDNFKALLNFL